MSKFWTSVVVIVVGLAGLSAIYNVGNIWGIGPQTHNTNPSSVADLQDVLATALKPLQDALASTQAELSTAKTAAEKAAAEHKAELEAVKAQTARPPAPPARDPATPFTTAAVQVQQLWLQDFSWSDGGDEPLFTAAIAFADGTLAETAISPITRFDSRGGELEGGLQFTIYGVRLVGGQAVATYTCPDRFQLPVSHIVAVQRDAAAQVTVYSRLGMTVELPRWVAEPGKITFHCRKPTRAEWERHAEKTAQARAVAAVSAVQEAAETQYQVLERAARSEQAALRVLGKDARLLRLEGGPQRGVQWLDGRNAQTTIADVAWTGDNHLRFRDVELKLEFVSTQSIHLPATGYFKVAVVVVPAASSP